MKCCFLLFSLCQHHESPSSFKTASGITQFLLIKLWLLLSHKGRESNPWAEDSYQQVSSRTMSSSKSVTKWIALLVTVEWHKSCPLLYASSKWDILKHGAVILESWLPCRGCPTNACLFIQWKERRAPAHPFRGPPSLTTLRWASCLFRWSL